MFLFFSFLSGQQGIFVRVSAFGLETGVWLPSAGYDQNGAVLVRAAGDVGLGLGDNHGTAPARAQKLLSDLHHLGHTISHFTDA